MSRNDNSRAPMLGEYVKLAKTGEFFANKGVDVNTQTVDIQPINGGSITTVQRSEVERVTVEENLDILRFLNKLGPN